jgi:hypothetical protein
MSASLRALLAGVIDYAGLFPPAKLPLDQALRNYARYRHGPERWMLGRFVCPAARLAELTPLAGELFQGDAPFAFSALGRGGSTVPVFLAELDADLRAIADFQHRQGERVLVDALEVRLPADAIHPHRREVFPALLGQMARHVSHAGLGVLALFCEISPGQDWRSSVSAVVDDLHQFNEGAGRGEEARCPVGYKLRSGGLEASAFPSVEQVAFTITAGRKVPMKFTAGLHHPIRHFDPVMQTRVHGFLNVLGAGVLAHARQLPEEEVQRIIADEDPADFVFADEGFRWKDLKATTDEIRIARRQAIISFGSCSFDEPRDDLRALGLLR